MKKIMSLLFISMFSFVGCASGTNPYFNSRNTLGVIGGAGGAAGGAILCKNCKGIAKVAAIGGGAILGLLAGARAGEYFDSLDRQRNIDLIKSLGKSVLLFMSSYIESQVSLRFSVKTGVYDL